MEFNASEVKVNKGNTYSQPGVHTLTVTEVKLETGGTNTPFINLIVHDETGSSLNRRFYLGEKPGNSGKSSFEYSMIHLKTIGVAAIGEDKYNTLKGSSSEEITSKLATLLVGKQFRGVVTGEEITTSSGSFVKSVLSNRVESVKVNPTKLKFTEVKDIKMLSKSTSTEAEVLEITKDTTEDWLK